MAALYPGTSVSGYNSNPPPDDGSTGSTNLITWNTDVKGKIGDPLNTFASSVDSNITSAFGKTLDGAAILAEGINYQVQAGDQGKLVKATASGITITTPDATAVGAPFMFAVNNQSSGIITLAGANPGVQQTVDGSNSQTIAQGGSCIVKTDGSNWFTIGLKPGTNTLTPSNYGFTDAVNINLQASVGSNILTIALKTKAGNDPSASDQVLIPFRDTTLTSGDPVWVSVTSALSINTNATGATLASQNNKPFRFWVVAFNNAGSAVLALWHSGAGASSIALNPMNEATLQSTTGISAAATSAGVFYTPNGTSLSGKAFRILGYIEYVTGLATAGTYSAAPDIVQLFGPGIKKPGDIVQAAYATATSGTTSSTTVQTATNTTVSLTPTSTANPVVVRATGVIGTVSNVNGNLAQISRGSGPTLIGTKVSAAASTNSGGTPVTASIPVTLEVLDAPNTTSSQGYTVYIASPGQSAAATWIGTQNGQSTQSTIIAQELMA